MNENEVHPYGSSPLRSQRDYGENKYAGRGSHDMTVDVGEKKKHKDLQKPPRFDRKKSKGLDEKDPDSKDVKKDPDLKLAKQLIKLAKDLLS